MKNTRQDGLYLLLLGMSVLFSLSVVLEAYSPASMVDFKPLYYGARCLLQHRDPYNPAEVQDVFISESAAPDLTPPARVEQVQPFIYLPSIFLVTVPLALLPFSVAKVIWFALTL